MIIHRVFTKIRARFVKTDDAFLMINKSVTQVLTVKETIAALLANA